MHTDNFPILAPKDLHPNSRYALSVAKFPFRSLTQTPAKSVDVTQSNSGTESQFLHRSV